MGKETKKETDFWGNEKEVHYEDGKKVGETKYRETFWGNKVQDHYDSSGNKTGETRREEGFFSDRAVHYDSEGNKAGYTKNDETFFGSKIQRHYDASGNEVGKSHYEEGIFGGHKKVHEGEYFKGGGEQGSTASGSYSDSSSASGIGIVFVVLICIGLGIAIIANLSGNRGQKVSGQSDTQQQGVSTSRKENTAPVPTISIGDKAVWQPSDDMVFSMRNSCEKNQYPDFDECVVKKMVNLGASTEAVAVSRYLLQLKYPFCFVWSLKHVGRIAIVKAVCPFMANTMGFTFLVNGIPSIVQVGGFKYLGRINLESHPAYATIRQKFPMAKLWSSSADLFVEMQNRPDGGQRFVYHHALLNGCRACEVSGVASIGYDFDNTGRFTWVQLLKLSAAEN